MKDVLHLGHRHAPNLTRYARVVLSRTIKAKADAEDVARIVRTALDAGTYVSAKAYRPPTAAPAAYGQTLDAIVEKYCTQRVNTDVTLSKDGRQGARARLRQLCDTEVQDRRLGDQPMSEITIEDLIAFRQSREGIANSTWNKLRTTIGQVYRWARWSGYLETDILVESPPESIRLLRRGKNAQRRRRISDEEWDDLVAAADELRADHGARLTGLLVALMETACRVGEVLALRWADVYLEQRQLIIRAVEDGARKTGTSRTLDISAVLGPILIARQHDPAGQPYPRTAYVFGDIDGGRIKRIHKAWGTVVLRAHHVEPRWTATGDFDAASRARLEQIDLHLHDVRHEAACRWLESGCFDLAQISQRLGHTTVAQTSTYLHAVGTSVRAAQQRYDAQRAAAAQHPRAQLAGSSPYKVPTNAHSARTAVAKPRLIKSANIRNSKGL